MINTQEIVKNGSRVLAITVGMMFADAAYAKNSKGDNLDVDVHTDVDVHLDIDNYNKNYTDVDVRNHNDNNNHNNNHNVANGGQGGNAHANGGNAISGSISGANADANAVVGDTTAIVGNTTAQTGDQTQSFQYSSTTSANAYAPTATANAGNGVLCGNSLGLSLGVGEQDFAISGGINLPMGVNETCMSHERSVTIINTGANIYQFNHAGGADLIGAGIAVMMQEDETVDAAVKFIAAQNCQSGNPMDRFRPNCGGSITSNFSPAIK